MWYAVQAVARMQGGFVVADGENILASLPAPVGGQMSDEPFEDFLNDGLPVGYGNGESVQRKQ